MLVPNLRPTVVSRRGSRLQRSCLGGHTDEDRKPLPKICTVSSGRATRPYS